MIKYLIVIGLVALWLYILWATDRAKLQFWHFIAGCMGLFIFLMILVRPVMTEPLARAVAAMAGLFGELTGSFTPYYKYGILFVEATGGAMTLQIDFECSGIVEIMAFLSLLIFYRVYKISERKNRSGIFFGKTSLSFIRLLGETSLGREIFPAAENLFFALFYLIFLCGFEFGQKRRFYI